MLEKGGFMARCQPSGRVEFGDQAASRNEWKTMGLGFDDACREGNWRLCLQVDLELAKLRPRPDEFR
jgi:hypothetical protein